MKHDATKTNSYANLEVSYLIMGSSADSTKLPVPGGYTATDDLWT